MAKRSGKIAVYLVAANNPLQTLRDIRNHVSYGDYLREKTIWGERAHFCELLLSEEIGLIEGVREIVSRSERLGLIDERNAKLLQQIDLQSKHFPLGDSRAQYKGSQLQVLDAERQKFESDSRDSILECCRQILAISRAAQQS